MHIQGHDTDPILRLAHLTGMHFDGVPWRNKSRIPLALGTACIYCRSMPALAILRLNLSGAYPDTPVNPGRLCHCIHKLLLPFRLPNRAIGCTLLLKSL